MHITSVKYSDKPFRVSTHYHDDHQILYIKKGKINITIGKNSYNVESGNILVLSRMEEHSVNVISGEYERYNLRISPENGATAENLILSSIFTDRSHFDHKVYLGEHAEEFEKYFMDMAKEYSEKKEMYSEAIDLIFKNFLIALYRKFPNMFIQNINENTKLVYEIQKKFEMQYWENYSLIGLSKEYNISPSYLSHLFKNVTGYAPMEYLSICRLIAAKKYLTTTKMRIKEIINACAYTDESNFSRMFKKRTNMTPSQFRNTYGK